VAFVESVLSEAVACVGGGESESRTISDISDSESGQQEERVSFPAQTRKRSGVGAF